jgi:hypothetical protein
MKIATPEILLKIHDFSFIRLSTECMECPQWYQTQLYLGPCIHLWACPIIFDRSVSRAVTSWLRHYATGRKVVGSIFDEIIVFFTWPNPSSGTMALGIDAASNRNEYNIPGSKERPAGAYGWPHRHLWADCLIKFGSFDVSQHYGPPWTVTGIALPCCTLMLWD